MTPCIEIPDCVAIMCTGQHKSDLFQIGGIQNNHGKILRQTYKKGIHGAPPRPGTRSSTSI